MKQFLTANLRPFPGLKRLSQWFLTFVVERNPNETFQKLEETLCINLTYYLLESSSKLNTLDCTGGTL